MQKGTPIPYVRVESSKQVKRNVFCSHYDECLDHTIKKRWQSFSCQQCHSYERAELDDGQWIEDSARCLNLIFHSNLFEAEAMNVL